MSHAFARTLLDAQTTDEDSVEFAPAAGEKIPTNGYTHSIAWSSGVTSGVVEIEGAQEAGYAGTWAPIATVTHSGSGSPKTEYVYSAAMFPVMRHRISTVVAGGSTPTVTTKISGSY